MNPYLFNSAYTVKSVLHRLDPRTKILAVFPLGITTYLARSEQSVIILSLFLLFCIFGGHVSFSFIRKTVFMFFWLFALTFLLHIVFTDGRLIFQVNWLNLRITEEGLRNGFFYSWRFFILITFSFILLYTTPPTAFTDGFVKLLTPLKKLKIPVDSFAITMGLILRFIPLFYEEVVRVRQAQQARGAAFSGSIRKRITSVISIIIPVFVSVLRKADKTAVVLEARGYRAGMNKTSAEEFRLAFIDYAGFFIIVILTCFILWLK